MMNNRESGQNLHNMLSAKKRCFLGSLKNRNKDQLNGNKHKQDNYYNISNLKNTFTEIKVFLIKQQIVCQEVLRPDGSSKAFKTIQEIIVLKYC